MNRRPRLGHTVLLATAVAGPLAWWVASATLAPSPALAQSPVVPIDLSAQLEEIRAAGNVPALAAAVVTADGVVARGAAGVRKLGDETPVTVNDLWHIGSITKSFTSATFARLVEAGQIRWDQTLAEVLPEAAGTPYAQATFVQLLSHHASLPANPSMASMGKSRTSKDPLTEQRRQIVAEVLAVKPVNPLGSFFLYSNAGYVTVGAALERLTEMPWEELVRAQVLTPLGLRSAGFGPPATAGAVDQPYGHMFNGATRPLHPIPPGPLADNPAMLGPAGTLHLSVDDLAAWVREHMNGEAGAGTLLSTESFRRLHREVGDRYALGWVDDHPQWADDERLVWHNGSNSSWYAMIGFFPERRLGFVVVTNGSLAAGEPVVTKAFQALAHEWIAKGGAAP